MNYIIKNISKALLLALPIIASSCCSDSNEAIQDEWTATYVYLQRIDYLTPSPKKFHLAHRSDGVKGEIAMPFVAKTQKPCTQDIKVHFSLISKTDKVSLEFLNQKGEPLTDNVLVIKAGQTHSDTIKVVGSKFEQLKDIEEQWETNFQVNLTDIETAQENTFISPVKDLQKLTAKIEKKPHLTLSLGQPANSDVLDRANWSITLDDIAEHPASNLFDEDFGTDVASSNNGFSFVLDLGAETALSGLYTTSWAYQVGTYAPQEIELLVSNDNTNWRSLGRIATGTGIQQVVFEEQPTARYLRYVITKMPSSKRVSLTEFYLFTPKK